MTLANDGARDFAGHRLCRACWNSIPRTSPTGAVIAQHACEGKSCECLCRLREREKLQATAPAKPARPAIQLEFPKHTIIIVG